jgi:hypothetical protein
MKGSGVVMLALFLLPILLIFALCILFEKDSSKVYADLSPTVGDFAKWTQTKEYWNNKTDDGSPGIDVDGGFAGAQCADISNAWSMWIVKSIVSTTNPSAVSSASPGYAFFNGIDTDDQSAKEKRKTWDSFKFTELVKAGDVLTRAERSTHNHTFVVLSDENKEGVFKIVQQNLPSPHIIDVKKTDYPSDTIIWRSTISINNSNEYKTYAKQQLKSSLTSKSDSGNPNQSKDSINQLVENEFSCLDKLWTRESDWTIDAENKDSKAYGIPQAYHQCLMLHSLSLCLLHLLLWSLLRLPLLLCLL